MFIMNGVLRSEANKILPIMILQACVAGFFTAFACFGFALLIYTEIGNLWLPAGSAVVAFSLGLRADKNFRVIKRYIVHPPTCHHDVLTSDQKQ